jgi:hypothetical protein
MGILDEVTQRATQDANARAKIAVQKQMQSSRGAGAGGVGAMGRANTSGLKPDDLKKQQEAVMAGADDEKQILHMRAKAKDGTPVYLAFQKENGNAKEAMKKIAAARHMDQIAHELSAERTAAGETGTISRISNMINGDTGLIEALVSEGVLTRKDATAGMNSEQDWNRLAKGIVTAWNLNPSQARKAMDKATQRSRSEAMSFADHVSIDKKLKTGVATKEDGTVKEAPPIYGRFRDDSRKVSGEEYQFTDDVAPDTAHSSDKSSGGQPGSADVPYDRAKELEEYNKVRAKRGQDPYTQ